MAISNRLPAVAVEYDKHGTRTVKQFANAHEAKRFYIAKLKAGKNPALTKPAEEPRQSNAS